MQKVLQFTLSQSIKSSQTINCELCFCMHLACMTSYGCMLHDSLDSKSCMSPALVFETSVDILAETQLLQTQLSCLFLYFFYVEILGRKKMLKEPPSTPEPIG